MEGQFFFHFLEIEGGVEVVVHFFLVVSQFHKIGEVEGDVSELSLIILMKHFLNSFHVLIW